MIITVDSNGDWKEWSKLVLHELKRLSDEQKAMTKVLIQNTRQLEEHMRRTSAAEERLDTFEEGVKPALDAYKFVAKTIKFILFIAPIIGIYFKYFR